MTDDIDRMLELYRPSITWVDRDGRVLRDYREIELLLHDPDYKILGRSYFGTFTGALLVSTVWLGLDHDFVGRGPPRNFETMVFTIDVDGSWGDGLLQLRTGPTDEQALAQHRRVCEILELGPLRRFRRTHRFTRAGALQAG